MQALPGDHDDELLRMLRDSVTQCLSRTGLSRVRSLQGTLPGHDLAIWQEMAAQGWLGVLIPDTCGGQNLTLSAAQAVVEPLASWLGPEPFVACAVEAASVLDAIPPGPQRDRLLSDIAEGRRIAVVAHDPSLHLSSSGQVSGQVAHVAAGCAADLFVVLAQSDDGPCLCLVSKEAAGLDIQPELRADGTFSALLRFDDVQAEKICVGSAAEAALRRGRAAAVLMTAAELFACMESALSMSLDYMKTRVQFDRPIGSFQALQHRAVDLFIQKELSRAVLDEAVGVFDSGAGADVIDMETSRAKARCSHAALLIARETIKLHGAIAVTDEYDLGLYVRRILSLAARFGNAASRRANYGILLARESAGPRLETETDPVSVPSVFMAAGPIEQDWNAFDDVTFRAGVGQYFAAEYPAHLRNLGRRGTTPEMREWLDKLVRKGWIAPNWPVAHGGMGLSPSKQIIFIEERERVGIARNPDQGVVMFGPMLMQYGTEAQKAAYLPGILRNEYIWCQGYSEPQAGSDLASLRTEAVADCGGYLINGSKIWTTMAHHATHMFLLARTDKSVRKQNGISFFILDLTTPGVTIRPIRNIAGHEEFCEVFFDDVRVPQENLVGPLNAGWTVAKTLLGYERLNNGSPRRVQGPLKTLDALARARGIAEDSAFRTAYLQIYLDIDDLKSNYARFCDLIRRGEAPGPELSQLKIWAGECAQRLTEFLIEVAGEAGGLAGPQQFGDITADILAPFYAMFPAQIASGSNDIQRNILATRVLGLPK